MAASRDPAGDEGGQQAMSERLAQVLTEEVFIRSQGWSQWPTLEEIRADAAAIVAAMGEATGFGGFDAWTEGTKRLTFALLDATCGDPSPAASGPCTDDRHQFPLPEFVVSGDAEPTCRDCGATATIYRCRNCGTAGYDLTEHACPSPAASAAECERPTCWAPATACVMGFDHPTCPHRTVAAASDAPRRIKGEAPGWEGTRAQFERLYPPGDPSDAASPRRLNLPAGHALNPKPAASQDPS